MTSYTTAKPSRAGPSADPVLTAAFGTELAATIVDVRRAEVDLFADAKPEDIAEAVRWRH